MAITANNPQSSTSLLNAAMSMSYTVPAGSNRVVVIAAGWENNITSTAPTFDGVSATELVQAVGDRGGAGIWAIKESVIAANSWTGVSKTVACPTTWTEGRAVVVTLADVDQSAGYVLDTASQTNADNLGFSVTLNPTEANGYAVGAMTARVAESVALTSGGWTTFLLGIETLMACGLYGIATASTTQNLAGSVSGGSATQEYTTVAASFKAATGGSTVAPKASFYRMLRNL